MIKQQTDCSGVYRSLPKLIDKLKLRVILKDQRNENTTWWLPYLCLINDTLTTAWQLPDNFVKTVWKLTWQQHDIYEKYFRTRHTYLYNLICYNSKLTCLPLFLLFRVWLKTWRCVYFFEIPLSWIVADTCATVLQHRL